MLKYGEQISKLFLLTLAGLFGSTILGLLIYGGNVFDPKSPGFSFISFGLSGAFIFAFYHVRGLSQTITAAVVASAVQFVGASAWITMVNAVVWSFGVNLPVVVLAFLFERKLAPLKHLKFVAVGALYGATFVLLTLLVALITGSPLFPAEVFRSNFLDGLLIGMGLGIGIEAGEALIHSVAQHAARQGSALSKT